MLRACDPRLETEQRRRVSSTQSRVSKDPNQPDSPEEGAARELVCLRHLSDPSSSAGTNSRCLGIAQP
jgi:hypothetical protein